MSFLSRDRDNGQSKQNGRRSRETVVGTTGEKGKASRANPHSALLRIFHRFMPGCEAGYHLIKVNLTYVPYIHSHLLTPGSLIE